MRVLLMHRDRDFSTTRPRFRSDEELVQDLNLDRVLDAMAMGEKFLREVAKVAILEGLETPEEVLYRQAVLADCLAHPELIREMYEIGIEALEGDRHSFWGGFGRNKPQSIVSHGVRSLQWMTASLRKLRAVADEHGSEFRSEAFTALFASMQRDLDDEYLETVTTRLAELEFRKGILVSAGLGPSNNVDHIVLRDPTRIRLGWKQFVGRKPSLSFEVDPRDEAGGAALEELTNRGYNEVANALGQSSDHVKAFFTTLCRELAFYLGCINLSRQLAARGQPTCLPTPSPLGHRTLETSGIYDVAFALTSRGTVVGNDISARCASLVMVTGANSGGKSTLLRSIGLAQLMMQSGMFVGASTFGADLVRSVFTHFSREEDPSMEHGKFDEELSRMDAIARDVHTNSLVLFNESFSGTNEREGSEIGRQVIRALMDSGVKVVFVTHFFDLSGTLFLEHSDEMHFLQAERRDDGARTFRFLEGTPSPTSYAQDIYRRMGGWGDARQLEAARTAATIPEASR